MGILEKPVIHVLGRIQVFSWEGELITDDLECHYVLTFHVAWHLQFRGKAQLEVFEVGGGACGGPRVPAAPPVLLLEAPRRGSPVRELS